MIEARYDGECPSCPEAILEGSSIGRVHGQWVCEFCVEENGGEDKPRPRKPDNEDASDFLMGGAPDSAEDAEEFLMAEDPEEYRNASGQPRPEYDMWGQQNRGYLITDPTTGEHRLYPYKNKRRKGWTRVTTFNKAASDSKALNDWGKRNVVIGAAMSPRLVDRARGLTHEDDSKELNSLVAKLEERAGAKVAADHGTHIHELTERWDAGQLTDLSSLEERYRQAVELYDAELKHQGFVPVPGLIERTTCVLEFGGVAGTLDRVYFHQASGKFLVGDVKTGKTLSYGRNENECQEAIYAHGLNRFGVFDWNTNTWISAADAAAAAGWDGPPVLYVSQDWGVIIHLPVQGKHAGGCRSVRADLNRGWQHAHLCHSVRSAREREKEPDVWDGTEFALGGPEETWEERFSGVRTTEDASRLWSEARADGLDRLELQRLVGIAQRALSALGS